MAGKTKQHTFGQPNPYLEQSSRSYTNTAPTYTDSMLTISYTYMHSLKSVGQPDEKRHLEMTVHYDLNDQVRKIKEKVMEMWHHPVERQVLYFQRSDRRAEMNDSDKIGGYGVTNATTLVLKVPPRPLTFVERRKQEEDAAHAKMLRNAHKKKISYTRYGNGSVNHMNL